MLTVLTPAASHDLTTLEAVKAELEVTGTLDDTVIAALIRQASATIARFCRRVFALETVRQVVTIYGRLDQAAGAEFLFLDRTPVAEIVSITVDGIALAPADYELDAENGKLFRLSGGYPVGWWGCRTVIVYRAGYDLLPGLPHDIERAAVDLVKRYYYGRSRDPALRSEQVLDVIDQAFTSTASEPMVDGLPADIAARLSFYRELA